MRFNYLVTALLILWIFNGAALLNFSIFQKAHGHPSHPSGVRYLARGLILIVVGGSLLFLLYKGSITALTAMVASTITWALWVTGEVLTAVKRRKELIRTGRYNPPEAEKGENERVERIIARGKSRYLSTHFGIYGAGGLALMATLNLATTKPLPLYGWIIIPLVIGWCGAAAASDRWKRTMRERSGSSLEQEPPGYR